MIPDVGLVAFRDPYGIKPIVFGEKTTTEGRWFACASESVVLDVTGYERTIDLGRRRGGLRGPGPRRPRRKISDRPHHPCIFELVYFARPDSFLDDISVYKTRLRFGEALAQAVESRRRADARRRDSRARLLARRAPWPWPPELGVPYREGLVKNRYIGRTFIMPNQASRSDLDPAQAQSDPASSSRARTCCSSTTRSCAATPRGASCAWPARPARRKVYFAVTSPPLVAPCPYGIDMATQARVHRRRPQRRRDRRHPRRRLPDLPRPRSDERGRAGRQSHGRAVLQRLLHRRVPDGRHHPRAPPAIERERTSHGDKIPVH